MTRKPISVCQRVAWGNSLKDARDCLQTMICTLPPGSRSVREARRAVSIINDQHCSLDTAILQESWIGIDPRLMATTVYCGAARFRPVAALEESLREDALAGFQETL